MKKSRRIVIQFRLMSCMFPRTVRSHRPKQAEDVAKDPLAVRDNTL